MENQPVQPMPTALYSLAEDNLRIEQFIPRDLGECNPANMPTEWENYFNGLFNKYGKENMVSLALGKHAEEYGYMPFKEAEKNFEDNIIPEILTQAFIADNELAKKLKAEWAVENGMTPEQLEQDLAKARQLQMATQNIMGIE